MFYNGFYYLCEKIMYLYRNDNNKLETLYGKNYERSGIGISQQWPPR